MQPMNHILTIIEAILGGFLALLILLQHRASGLSATFGGGGTAYVQRRGAEKFLFTATVWIAVFFFGIAIVLMYV
jgi:protein translocase SecG subunit